jgi:hypothetical protein
MRVAAAEVVGEVGQAVDLGRGQLATGHPQAQHEAVLCRRDVEEPEELEAIGVFGIRRRVLFRVPQQAVPGVERILFILPALLLAQV